MISVIVAVYNIEKYISRCIESILDQSYKDLEILLIDDGSTDNSGKICDQYAEKDARITVVHQKNQGPSNARNKGLQLAKGDYITFVDGDDWIDYDMYEKLIGIMLEYNADVVVCRYRSIYRDFSKDGSTGKTEVFDKQYEMLGQYFKEEEEILIQPAVWNKIYKSEILRQIEFPEGMCYGEDAVFTVRALSKVRKGIYFDKAFYNHEQERGGSLINAKMSGSKVENLIRSNLKIENYLTEIQNKELLCMHRFFFYKRLLMWYREMYNEKDGDLAKYRNEIVSFLRKRRNTLHDVYNNPLVPKSEEIKAKIFIFSPRLYRVIMALNDAVILPLRLRRIEKK